MDPECQEACDNLEAAQQQHALDLYNASLSGLWVQAAQLLKQLACGGQNLTEQETRDSDALAKRCKQYQSVLLDMRADGPTIISLNQKLQADSE